MHATQEEMSDRLGQFREACRAHGLKLTHQRLVIFEEMIRSDGHPDADAVFRAVSRRISSVSLDTIYRNLRLFEDLGLLQTRDLGSGRLRFDANTHPHHHYICTRCGAVQDFEIDSPDLPDVARAVTSLGKVDTIYIELRGICRACAGN